MNKYITVMIVTALVAGMIITTTTAQADRNDKPHNGNNGQCIKLQKTFPEEIQDFEGCHTTFTGKGHNDPEPLP